MQETAAHHPNQFLADLASVMRTTAETSRTATIDQCQADAKAYVEQLHTRSEDGAQGLRKAAEDDVATIEERSKASVERVRAEAEQRIARRRELLEQELQEYAAAVDREVERVQERVTAFEGEVALFFEQLQGVDPATFATMASQMPSPPAFAELDLQALGDELREKHDAALRAAAAETAGSGSQEEELPAGWWLDSPATLAAEAQEVALDEDRAQA